MYTPDLAKSQIASPEGGLLELPQDQSSHGTGSIFDLQVFPQPVLFSFCRSIRNHLQIPASSVKMGMCLPKASEKSQRMGQRLY